MVGLGVEPLALLERGPQPGVAHDDRVDHPERVEGELILPEHAELVGPDDRALLRLQLAGEQLHEGGLAGAVRPGQAVAPAGEKVVVTSSKSTFEPYRIDTPLTEIIVNLTPSAFSAGKTSYSNPTAASDAQACWSIANIANLPSMPEQ